jgi:hypothetical protein
MKTALLVVSMLFLACSSFAQGQAPRKTKPQSTAADLEAQRQFIGVLSPDATSTCSFNFTSGTGLTFLKFCVTKNGNITQFQSPSGIEYINVGTVGEGYSFCDFDSRISYFDFAGYGDSGNWGPAVTTSTPTSVKVVRTTSDQIYTLTQTIIQNKALGAVKVQMALKNNTTTARHVGLLRYADVDAQGQALNDFDYTDNTALAYNSEGHGLEQQEVSATGAAYNGAFSQLIAGGPDACQPFMHVVAPLTDTDGSIFIQYDLMLGAKKSQSGILNYKAF